MNWKQIVDNKSATRDQIDPSTRPEKVNLLAFIDSDKEDKAREFVNRIPCNCSNWNHVQRKVQEVRDTYGLTSPYAILVQSSEGKILKRILHFPANKQEIKTIRNRYIIDKVSVYVTKTSPGG